MLTLCFYSFTTNTFLAINNQHTGKSLENRKALVTGGSSGIGLAIARRLCSLGVGVVAADKQLPAQATKEDIQFVTVDISQQQEVDALFQQLHQQQALPDIVVSCAGIGIGEQIAEGDPAKWQQVFNTNVMGALRCARAFLPHMQALKRGDVVFISSVAARKPYPWGGVYSASKAALQTVAETLRMEVQPHIRVGSILPGVVDTNFFNNSFGQSAPSDDLGWGALSATDVADAIVYMLTRPSAVAINEMVLRPAGQVF